MCLTCVGHAFKLDLTSRPQVCSPSLSAKRVAFLNTCDRHMRQTWVKTCVKARGKTCDFGFFLLGTSTKPRVWESFFSTFGGGFVARWTKKPFTTKRHTSYGLYGYGLLQRNGKLPQSRRESFPASEKLRTLKFFLVGVLSVTDPTRIGYGSSAGFPIRLAKTRHQPFLGTLSLASRATMPPPRRAASPHTRLITRIRDTLSCRAAPCVRACVRAYVHACIHACGQAGIFAPSVGHSARHRPTSRPSHLSPPASPSERR